MKIKKISNETKEWKAKDEELIKELDMEWEKVDSSFINSIRYDEPHKEMVVFLHNGKFYAFKDIDRKTYNKIMASKSKGKYLNKLMKIRRLDMLD